MQDLLLTRLFHPANQFIGYVSVTNLELRLPSLPLEQGHPEF